MNAAAQNKPAPQGAGAKPAVPAATSVTLPSDYVIGPADVLTIT